MKTLIIALLMLPLPVLASPLNDEESNKELLWQVINVIDYGQTMNIAKECNVTDRFEYNPVLGVCPSQSAVRKYFIGSALLHYGITRYLWGSNRETWQNVTIVVSGSIVYHNYSIGLRVDF